jgi:lysozyme
VLRRLNEGALLQAACEMEMWRKADFEGERIVVDALVRRRSAEKALFLTPPDGHWVAAPSSVLRPKIDHDAGRLVPSQTPAAITTALSGDKAVALRADGSTAPALTGAGPQRQRTGRRRGRRAPGSDPAGRGGRRAVFQGLAAPNQDQDPPEFYRSRRRRAAVHPCDARAAEAPAAATPFPDAGGAAAEPAAPGARPSPACSRRPARRPPGRCSIWAASRPAAARRPGSPGRRLRPASSRTPSAASACWSCLGLLGLALFGGGILWNLSVGASEGCRGRMFGWAASLIGMICFATSAYLLMRRLGDPEPQGED